MTDNLESTLESTGRASDDIHIISNTDSGDAHGANVETKLGVVQGVQAGVDVTLKMTASADMALAIAFLLPYPSAQLSIFLEMTFSVNIGVSAVLKVVTALSRSKELPNLDLPFN